MKLGQLIEPKGKESSTSRRQGIFLSYVKVFLSFQLDVRSLLHTGLYQDFICKKHY